VVGTLTVPLADCVLECPREGSIVEVESNLNPLVGLSISFWVFLLTPSREDSDLRVLEKVGILGLAGGEEVFLDEKLARMSLLDVFGSERDGGVDGFEFLRNRAGLG